MRKPKRVCYAHANEKVSDAKKILEIGFGNGKQLQMLYKYWNDKFL